MAVLVLEVVPFMSDEPVAAVAVLPALQYTLNNYLLYLGQVQECVTALSRGEGTCWWARRVSRTPVRVEGAELSWKAGWPVP